MSCDDNTKGSWCIGKSCDEDTPSDCLNNYCYKGKCDDGSAALEDAFDTAADGMATGIIILIIVLICICCCIVGCIVCCVMGVGFCAKKGAEAAAAQQ